MKKMLLSAVALVMGLTASAQTVLVPVGGPQIMQRNGSEITVDRDEAWFRENFDAAAITQAWEMGVWLEKDYVVYEDADVKITAAVAGTPAYFQGNKATQIEKDGHIGYFNMGSTLPDQTLTGDELIMDIDALQKQYMGILRVTPAKNGTLGAKIYAGDSKRCFGIYALATDAELDDDNDDNDGCWGAYVNFRNGDPAKDENLECSYHHEHHEINAPEYITCEAEAGRDYLIIAGGQKNLNLSMITFEAGENTGIAGVETAGEKAVEAYYTLDGMRLNAPVKGVTIVKYTDGTTVKVIK